MKIIIIVIFSYLFGIIGAQELEGSEARSYTFGAGATVRYDISNNLLHAGLLADYDDVFAIHVGVAPLNLLLRGNVYAEGLLRIWNPQLDDANQLSLYALAGADASWNILPIFSGSRFYGGAGVEWRFWQRETRERDGAYAALASQVVFANKPFLREEPNPTLSINIGLNVVYQALFTR